MSGMVVIASVVVLSLGPAACSGDEESAGPDVERYCELALEVEGASDELGEPETPEQAKEFLVDLVDGNDAKLTELVEVAPDEISADVEKLVGALRNAADGDLDALEEIDDAKITEFEEKNCEE